MTWLLFYLARSWINSRTCGMKGVTFNEGSVQRYWPGLNSGLGFYFVVDCKYPGLYSRETMHYSRKYGIFILAFYRPLATLVAFVNKYTYQPHAWQNLVDWHETVNFHGYTLQYEPNIRPWNTNKNAFVHKNTQLSKQITDLYKQRWLPPSFFVQLCTQSGTGRSDIMAAGQRRTGLSAQLRSKAYAILFLSRQVRATIVANSR